MTARVPGFIPGTPLVTPLLDSGSEVLGGRLYDRGQDDSSDTLTDLAASGVVLDAMRYSIAVNLMLTMRSHPPMILHLLTMTCA